jgi:hypothetical protein
MFINLQNILSQGFDWQWSARLPIENPHNYYGISANYGLDYFVGHISFVENKVYCQNFGNGNGNDISFGVNLEHWTEYNHYAFFSALQYKNYSVISSSVDLIPLNEEVIGKYKTILDYNFNQIDLLVGIKYRILETHFSIGAGLSLGYIVSNGYTATEEILGPTEVPPFSTNPPSYTREITSGELKQLNNFVIKPFFRLGYDLELGRGTYIEPHLCILFPLWSMISGDKVNHYSASFGINLYRMF